MRRTMIGAAAGLMVLAGCTNGSAEPAQPPTQEDALTTATVAPAPPPDEAEVTTEPPVTSDEDEETETPEADGPPEMPDEAKEQTQEGAIAFALHYLKMVNYTGQHPEEGLLEPLAADGCKSCDNHEQAVSYGVESGDYLLEDTFDIGTPDVIFTEDSARVAVPVTQREQDFYRNGKPLSRTSESAEATLVIRVQWDDPWAVSEITVEQ